MDKPAQVGDVVEYVNGVTAHKKNLGAIGVVIADDGSHAYVRWISCPSSNAFTGEDEKWQKANLKVLVKANDVAK